MNLIDEMNPFNRAVTLYEKRKNVGKTIAGMKRKYVTFKQLQDEMELEDHEMEDMIADMKRKNRHSNKYIFTELEGEPAVGVTAAKRKRKTTPEVSVAGADLIVGKRREHKKKMSKVARLTNDVTNQHESVNENIFNDPTFKKITKSGAREGDFTGDEMELFNEEFWAHINAALKQERIKAYITYNNHIVDGRTRKKIGNVDLNIRGVMINGIGRSGPVEFYWSGKIVDQIVDLFALSDRLSESTVNESFDSDDSLAQELYLYIDSDAQLYRQRRLPIYKNLARKAKKDQYDSKLAQKGFMYLVDDGAKKYVKEMGMSDKWNIAFPKNVRMITALKFVEDFEDAWENKDYDFMEESIQLDEAPYQRDTPYGQSTKQGEAGVSADIAAGWMEGMMKRLERKIPELKGWKKPSVLKERVGIKLPDTQAAYNENLFYYDQPRKEWSFSLFFEVGDQYDPYNRALNEESSNILDLEKTLMSRAREIKKFYADAIELTARWEKEQAEEKPKKRGVLQRLGLREEEELEESLKEKYKEYFKGKMKDDYDAEKLSDLSSEQKSEFFKGIKKGWKKEKKKYVNENRHFELRRIYRQSGWQGLMNQPEFPLDESWKSMTPEDVILEMASE